VKEKNSMNDQNTPKLSTWQEFHNELIVKALKDENFRKELIADPKAVVEKEIGKIKEGMKLPATLEIKVIEQPANAIYLVLPTVTDELSDEALDGVAGGKDFKDWPTPQLPNDPRFKI
jgi:hypothetical protein